MSIWKRLFGEWEIIDSAPCEFNVRVLCWDADIEGTVIIEQNNKTGYKRAYLQGYNQHPISVLEAEHLIREYKC